MAFGPLWSPAMRLSPGTCNTASAAKSLGATAASFEAAAATTSLRMTISYGEGMYMVPILRPAGGVILARLVPKPPLTWPCRDEAALSESAHTAQRYRSREVVTMEITAAVVRGESK